MKFPSRILLAVTAGVLTSMATMGAESGGTSSAVAIEAIQRLKGADLEANPALKTAINRVLDQIPDQPAFVDIVRDFDLRERVPQVLGFIGRHPLDPVSVDGMRFVLKHDTNLVAKALTNDAAALPLLPLAGRAGKPDTLAVVAAVAGDSARPPANREAAVLGLVATEDGCRRLLGLLDGRRLGGGLEVVALRELQGVRWSGIRDAATKLGSLTRPGALPAKAALIAMAGDAARGAKVFRKPDVGCQTCHQVNGEGVDFGPRLSEIGAKLGKDALYDAIVEPSLGIAFGFEAWLFTSKDGDETLGLVTSETEDAVLVRLPGGQSTRLPKADIAKREKQAQSIMPAGLQSNLTAQEFADLLEYLSGLRKSAR